MSEPRQVLYRGVPMIEGWPEKIRAAQQLRTYTLSGRAIPRIPYGSERMSGVPTGMHAMIAEW